jgi:hypothetical protein
MDVLGLAFVLVIPAVGFLILWLAISRWGRKNDPMKPSSLDHLSPGAANRQRSSFDD